ncbi:MAG: calpastatin [Sphingomonas sp. 28-66-16]|nr:MAG: calpastatin [Sphingomonas sp. 28-66-16]
MTYPYDLDRFIAAQAGSYEAALSEIRRGAKRSHWMWYIFPQIAGLGRSHMAQRYAIRSLDEARAYLAHPTLGPRLRTCVETLQDLTIPTAEAVFGQVDAMKLRSSLTLFRAADGGDLFAAALDRWFSGAPDPATFEILGVPPAGD